MANTITPKTQPPSHIFTPSHTLSGKMHRMREAMYFFDPPEYYQGPGMTSGQRVIVSGAAAEGQSQGGARAASFASNRRAGW